MDRMVSKVASLNNLRHDLHHKRVQQVTDNAVKANSDLFKTSKILHHVEMDPKQEVKALREMKEKVGQQHSRINSWINEELKHN
jgi:galactitol-specific phosphotransferase system IIB component